jgi:hypothetical protein
MAQRRRLTHLVRDLGRLTGAPIPYRRLYTAALDGRIPAEQGENGIWTYRAEDVPSIAAALGLSAASSQVAA